MRLFFWDSLAHVNPPPSPSPWHHSAPLCTSHHSTWKHSPWATALMMITPRAQLCVGVSVCISVCARALCMCVRVCVYLTQLTRPHQGWLAGLLWLRTNALRQSVWKRQSVSTCVVCGGRWGGCEERGRWMWGKGKVDGWVWVQACSWTLINVACHSRISASICTSLVHNPSAMSREPWLWCPFYYSRFSYTSSSLKIEVINDTLMVWPSVQEVEKCEMLNYLIEMSNERDSTIRLHGEVFSIHMENYHFIFALLHRNTCLNGTRYWRKATA
jgi:hypothetical protein